jgi:hypothetical protein
MVTKQDSADRAAAELRDAAGRGDFFRAEAALKLYADLLGPLLADLSPAEAKKRLQDACELIEWSRRNLCAARARVADEIRRLDSINEYHHRLAAQGEN